MYYLLCTRCSGRKLVRGGGGNRDKDTSTNLRLRCQCATLERGGRWISERGRERDYCEIRGQGSLTEEKEPRITAVRVQKDRKHHLV